MYFLALCILAVKALARMHICACSSEPLLLAILYGSLRQNQSFGVSDKVRFKPVSSATETS